MQSGCEGESHNTYTDMCEAWNEDDGLEMRTRVITSQRMYEYVWKVLIELKALKCAQGQ